MKLNKIKVAIVDDHQIVIDGIAALLNGHENIEIVVTTTSAIEMVTLLVENRIDVLLTDIMMPLMSGQELAKQVKSNYPTIKILVLSMDGKVETVSEMINKADIAGYVLKNIGKQELIKAIETIAKGGNYFDETILNELEHFSASKKSIENIRITSREIEIIGLIEKELSNKQIAAKLFISEQTVETHRKNIYRKTNTINVLGLIKYAYEHKLV